MMEVAGGKKLTPLITGNLRSPVYMKLVVHVLDYAKTSMLKEGNPLHACKNVFVTNGACMMGRGNQNPSILNLALTARAVNYAGRK